MHRNVHILLDLWFVVRNKFAVHRNSIGSYGWHHLLLDLRLLYHLLWKSSRLDRLHRSLIDQLLSLHLLSLSYFFSSGYWRQFFFCHLDFWGIRSVLRNRNVERKFNWSINLNFIRWVLFNFFSINNLFNCCSFSSLFIILCILNISRSININLLWLLRSIHIWLDGFSLILEFRYSFLDSLNWL